MKSDRKTIAAWSLYDFANSAYITLIVTFIFNSYFTRRIADDPTSGTVLWTWGGVATSAAIVGIMSPFLGAIADHSGRKKPFLAFFTVLCAICTTMLFTVGRGDVVPALIFFVLANIGFEAANVFYNAFLPEIATKETIGRVSGIGWATGYAGGLICMALALGMITQWLSKTDDFNVRATNLLAAGWYAFFAIPIFLFVRETPRNEHLSAAELLRVGVQRLSTTFHHLRQFREAAKLLIASLVYNNGLTVVFSLAAIYAAAAFGMSQEEVLKLGLWLNVVAGIGAFSFGFVNDRIGGKKTIAISLVGLIVATLMGAMAQTKAMFWIASTLLGIMVGPNQAASRSLLGVLIPENKHAEAFGFFAFSGKTSSIVGPILYGLILQLTRNQRYAMASIVVFFVVGLAILMMIDEKRGIALADEASRTTQ